MKQSRRPAVLQRRRERWRNTVRLNWRASPQVIDRIQEVSELEGVPMGDIANTLLLLGIGVWRKMREHPELAKARIFKHTPLAALLLLADRALLLGVDAICDDEAKRWVEYEKRASRRASGEGLGVEPTL